ncbi:GFA family protein [Pseudomonas sp. J452]|uniref:GFA family protein n=1 Tax=Pseudomonas sp. J452 TaxID=2898441 RepID=UPI0039181683
MATSLVATCTCGGFRFESEREPIFQLTCHCLHCRQVSQAPSTNFAFFKLAESEVKGKTVVHSFTTDSGTKTIRETCATCGEMLLDRTEGFPQIIGVVADRIQPPYEFQARCHVWVASKCNEVAVPEGVKMFAGNMH